MKLFFVLLLMSTGIGMSNPVQFMPFLSINGTAVNSDDAETGLGYGTGLLMEVFLSESVLSMRAGAIYEVINASEVDGWGWEFDASIASLQFPVLFVFNINKAYVSTGLMYGKPLSGTVTYTDPNRMLLDSEGRPLVTEEGQMAFGPYSEEVDVIDRGFLMDEEWRIPIIFGYQAFAFETGAINVEIFYYRSLINRIDKTGGNNEVLTHPYGLNIGYEFGF